MLEEAKAQLFANQERLAATEGKGPSWEEKVRNYFRSTSMFSSLPFELKMLLIIYHWQFPVFEVMLPATHFERSVYIVWLFYLAIILVFFKLSLLTYQSAAKLEKLDTLCREFTFHLMPADI